MIRKICLLLAAVLLLTACVGLFSCADPNDPLDDVKNLLPDVPGKQPANPLPPQVDDFASAERDFSVRLLQSVYAANEGDNTLLSPLSVMIALSMTAKGAIGETQEQMLEVLGGLPIDQLVEGIGGYIEALPSNKYAKLHSANSIWFRDTPLLQLKDSYLNDISERFSAGLYQAPFDDTTKDAINAWCSENTDGMIKEILRDPIDPLTMMYLINALLFDAQWENTYSDAALRDGKFTTENGQQQNVTMMHSVEDYYLRDELATGMVKYYAAGGYKFVAMLPNEGVSIKDYVASLSGEGIAKMMQESEFAFVKTQLPKFSYDCSYGLKKILSDMGMPLAFAGGADFTDMGTYDGGSLHIGAVIHKTAIEVNKVGTRAAAVTAVQMDDESAAPMDRKNYEITFDRPFVYMIVDRYNLPLFVGVVNSVN